VHLKRFAGGEQSVDGLPERVCMPIPAGRIEKLRVTPLGHLMLDREAHLEDSALERMAAPLLSRTAVAGGCASLAGRSA
jgi:hypothetical protein